MTVCTIPSRLRGRGSRLRPSILVADDDPITRMLVRSRLEGLGADVIESEDGFEALRAMEANPVDLLIVDLEMPNMNGLELIGRVRGQSNTQHLPIIVLTGSESRSVMEAALSAGATALLSKPLDWTGLGNAVQSLLNP